jgi:hypothetical protein
MKRNITGVVGKPEGKILRGSSRHKWVENIKIKFKSIRRKVMACTVFFWLR